MTFGLRLLSPPTFRIGRRLTSILRCPAGCAGAQRWSRVGHAGLSLTSGVNERPGVKHHARGRIGCRQNAVFGLASVTGVNSHPSDRERRFLRGMRRSAWSVYATPCPIAFKERWVRGGRQAPSGFCVESRATFPPYSSCSHLRPVATGCNHGALSEEGPVVIHEGAGLVKVMERGVGGAASWGRVRR